MNLFDALRARIEPFIMTHLVGQDSPGPIFRRVFKIPILLYKLGLWQWAGPFIMLIHTGRKSGKTRYTPLEYTYETETDSYLLMSGWRGQTDWYHNVRANPQVRARVGRREFSARAEPLSAEETARLLANILKTSPGSAQMLSRWSAEPLSAGSSSEALVRGAAYFPSIRLKPSP